MRRLLLALPLLAAACATPQEQCISRALRDVRTLDGLIAETRGNLERGYGLRTEQEVVVRNRRCSGTTSSGEQFVYPCQQTETVDRRVPVALDLQAERDKLESLLQRRQREEAQAMAQSNACRAAYPE
ncbi:hypothetical protein [Pseudoroseicyclus tamaricis]|uniref:Lipoprotein n=1 Tax=Pseudoroseicyclus tamaricis TaxID=2705421 RepID=A0A6B2JNZ4_9RHOB|nr:hypothetical protein [Pseudoroseicyclus tamaricis]NDU99767.1 hypothetical protein [Pseudoroseicyclus tamaricis]